tara:strand:+ start:2082 stop:2882 length:801 start_codon:yes stop_codon:yes gene_type:complete
MVDREVLERVARRTAQRVVEDLVMELNKKTFEAADKGMLHSSWYVLTCGDITAQKSKQVAEAVAEVIASACGEATVEYIDMIQRVFAEQKKQLLENFVTRTKHLNLQNSSLLQGPKNIADRIDENFQHCIDELKVGLIEGRKIVISPAGDTFNISDSSGVVAGSRDVAMQIGRDNLSQSIGWEASALIDAVAVLRRDIPAAQDLSEDAKLEIDDAAASLEREAASGNPDHGRLRRIVARLESFATGTGSSLLANHLPNILALLPLG